MKFSEKMCLKIILKVAKIQGFTLSLEDTFFEFDKLTDLPATIFFLLPIAVS